MTRTEIIKVIESADDDDIGDALLELAVEYWLKDKDISPDDFRFLVDEVLEEQ